MYQMACVKQIHTRYFLFGTLTREKLVYLR